VDKSQDPARGRAGSNFLCHAAQSFGEDWETTSHNGKSQKPKTRKGNYIVNNRNIQFKATALRCKHRAVPGLLIPVLLGCFAVFISATTPAIAGQEVLFTGTVSGQIPADLGPPVPGTGGCAFSFFVSNAGNATVLGSFTGTSTFTPNLCDGSYTGAFNWVAANGDRLSGSFMGQNIPSGTPGVFNNFETAVITGGTGRFKHATGIFNLYGQANFNTGAFVLPFLGTIEVSGRNR
jgi:hypothetical protein